MQLNLDSTGQLNIIRAYGKGWIIVNEEKISCNVIVAPQQLILDWPPQRLEDLQESHLLQVLDSQPEIVLLGTGQQQLFPRIPLTQSLWSQGIGLEIMDTAAACRTYNIIVAEGRRVAAALLMI